MDCFAGSGSTLIVANQLKRNWIGIDNSNQSFDVIKQTFKKDNVKCNFYEYVSID
jgi:DNA modification methylase